MQSLYTETMYALTNGLDKIYYCIYNNKILYWDEIKKQWIPSNITYNRFMELMEKNAFVETGARMQENLCL